MTHRIVAIICLGALLSVVGGLARADGMVMVRVVEKKKVKVKVSSDAQQALLLWKDGQETLHVRSSYKGPAVDFAWIIPVPARPTVKRSTWETFTSAEMHTRPEVHVKTWEMRSRGFGCSAPARRDAVLSAPVASSVRRLETLQIRELQVDILAAQDGGGFVAWLRKNGYGVDDGAKAILDTYVKKKFFFIAVKMRKSGMWARFKTREGQVARGFEKGTSRGA